jgi:predicted DsbA family dithiol-disulfide isomerase
MKITIDIVSDVVCPWCYVGKRRLEKALAAFQGRCEFSVHWHPFELNPTMPAGGMERERYREAKFGSKQRSEELDARLVAVGQEEGITFAFDRLKRTPNTLDAHRLIRLGAAAGCEDQMVEALFVAYFTRGIDLTDRKDLLAIATSVGLDGNTVGAHLESQAGIAEVRSAEEAAHARQIQGVPHFTIGTSELAGAQPPAAFLELFERTLAGETVGRSPTNTRFIR